jgi:hypothetical protein
MNKTTITPRPPRPAPALPPAKRPTAGFFRGLLTVALLGALTTLTVCFSAAPADAASPWWHITTNVQPANIAPGGEGTLLVHALNLGDAPTTGDVTLSDLVPEGLKIQEEEVEGAMVPKISFFAFSHEAGNEDLSRASAFGFIPLELCSVSGQRVSCQTKSPNPTLNAPPFTEPPFTEPPESELLGVPTIQPYEDLEIRIGVKDEGAASGAQNSAEVRGGSAAAATLKRGVPIGEPASFGPEEGGFAIVPEEEGGGVDVQAGSHPYQLTTTFDLNQNADLAKPAALARNLHFDLPAGLIGNAVLLPQCSDADFAHVVNGGYENLCPPDTVVGVADLTIDEPINLGVSTQPVPLFNLAPEKGEPARFGFEIVHAPVTLNTSVRTGSDYGMRVSVSNITELANFISSTVTFWGVPGDQSHDDARGWTCLAGGHWTNTSGRGLPCQSTDEASPDPFLTMPSSCSLPYTASVEGVSWPTPAHPEGIPFPSHPYNLTDALGRPLSISGCNGLAFDPTIEAQPDVSSASTPTGLATTVRVPQEVSRGANGLASSAVRNISVKFPRGVTVNPASADGLEACSEQQVGFTGAGELDPAGEPGAQTDLFTPTIGAPFCPDASKIGTVVIKTPVIAHPLEGALYLATQDANPFNTLIATYIVAEDPVSGVLVKLPGKVALDPSSGQLTATFENSPQAPLESAEIHLFGGDRAPLSTPTHCGTYTTNATFTPWSGTAPVTSTSNFSISSGPNGGGCPPAALPFTPTLAAGSPNVNAGAFSALITTIGREDGQQNINKVQLHFAPGMSGILAGIPLCPEAQANAGTCSSTSEIGKTIVSVGLGGDPFTVTGGQVFLTEKIAGSPTDEPFGLSIVNPAVAGPFDLGKVIVRATIEVDPHTAALTVTTGEIPHILDGIPLQIKHVNVTIDGVGANNKFTFNPTNCNPQSITGNIGSVEGASSPVSTPFQATNCQALKFEPKFSVSTAGKNTKAGGATLTAKLSEPATPFGTQANITRVKVDLPKQLPSRLTTLQKACTNAQFEANPANCPKESKIGFAKVTTPLLPVPLEGPAIFVSHGGEAFPSLTMVLQGYGVTVDLVGTTNISKAGITSTTFKTVPDVPFDTFTLTLPQGKFSALAANVPTKDHYSLCGQTLAMPTEFLAQNGAKINESTKIGVTGCAKAKTLTRAQKLTKALKACRKKKGSKRTSCEKATRKQYGPLKAKKKGK